jgi:hypothetical protein
MASTYLQRTMGTATNRNIFTLSMWVKLSKLGSDLNDYQFCDFYVSGSIRISLYHNDDDTLRCHMEGGGSYTNNLFTTSAKIRDTNAWYHLVWRFDTTQATASDRVRVYINGELATFSDYNPPTQNFNLQQGTSSYTQYIGKYGGSTDNNFDGVMSHIHFCDGYSYDASAFGSTDSTTGEWKINTAPSVTYGNNGFFILKDGNSVTDQSGEGNNFTVGGGTLTKTEDCPSNVFATFNPLIKTPSGLSFSNGNNTLTTTNSQWEGCATTLAASSGKWYWEAKYNTGSGIRLDIARLPKDLRFFDNSNQSYLTYAPYGYGYQLNNSGYDYYGNNNSMTTWTTNRGNSTKIYMVAVDLDNGKWWIGADGSWFNKSGTANPVTGADPLHDFSANLNGDPWLFGMSVEGSGGSHNANFGNGYFGTTAVSSEGSNASGIGIFEYDVPTGYTALSTKGLNE